MTTMMIEAVYRNGALIPQRRLEHLHEGQTVQVLIALPAEVETARARFWQFVTTHPITLPSEYPFQREELYER